LSGLSGVVDNQGEILIPLIYQEIERFRGENKTVVKNNGRVIDRFSKQASAQ
jgi:hypothetical protein